MKINRRVIYAIGIAVLGIVAFVLIRFPNERFVIDFQDDESGMAFSYGDLDTAEIPKSYLRGPIGLPLSDLAKILNEKIPNELVERTELSRPFEISVERIGKIRLSGEGSAMKWEVPLRAIVYNGKGEVQIQASGKMFFKSSFDVSSNWTLITQTELLELQWVDEPRIDFLSFRLDLSKWSRKVILRNGEKICADIDEKVKEVDVSSILDKTWYDLQKPIRIHKKLFKLWLQIVPERVQVFEINFDDDFVLLNIGVESTIISHVNAIPEDRPFVPLMKATHFEQGEHTEVHAHAHIDYDLINGIIDTALIGKPIRAADYTFTFSELYFAPENEKLSLTGEIKGYEKYAFTAYGSPNYNLNSRRIGIRDFDFEFKTKSSLLAILLKPADYGLQKVISRYVSENMVVETGPLVDSLPRMIHRSVEEGKAGDKITVFVHDLQLRPEILRFNEVGLDMVFEGKGILELEIDRLRVDSLVK